MDIRITNIDWDTDGEEIDLPSDLVINTAVENIDDPEQELADWLSNKFGWSVNNFSYEQISDTPSFG